MSGPPSPPPVGGRADVLQRATAAMTAAGVDALLLGPGADLRYLTGYHAPALERLTLLVARADGGRQLVLPGLERARAEGAVTAGAVGLRDYAETDDPYAAVAECLSDLGPRPTLAVGDRMWSVFLLRLQHLLPAARWQPASTVTAPLRMRKTAAEVDALRRAGQAIDRVHARVPELLRPGRTEAEVGRELADLILAEGHEQVNFVIVASGPNSASPHHETGSRALADGDAVVVDVGGKVDGYCSDCTRDYLLGAPPDGYDEAHAALEAAQEAACERVRPGVSAGSVDDVARGALTRAGYGAHFVHRTGHGVGLEEHEEPYIVAGNDLPLEPGMVFSVEPGVYLPGRFGQRVEDVVVVTDDGCERLNAAPRAALRA